MKIILLFSCLLIASCSFSQTCTSPGQNPSTAFPVCGTSTFSQSSVPQCGGRDLPFSGCGSDPLSDLNPYWYKFTCFQSGTLSFLITPNDMSDDYDWELYDITGKQPDDVYTIGSLVISNNWSGDGGLTGASSAGSSQFVCAGLGKPRFSRMPTLTAGHNYLLLVSHFTQSQSGYKLSFSGGTAVITDPADPSLKKVEASCGGDELRLKISKNIKCNSITSTGSEFYITPAVANVINAVGYSCNTKFDTDSIRLQLSTFLPPGNYTLHIRKGSDGNTLLDYCDHPVVETETIPFVMLPRAPTPMDSLTPPACAPKSVTLVFKKLMLCSSVEPSGSDFTITGPYPVTIVGASGNNCTNGTSKEITVTFSSPLQTAGNFNIVLRKGSDGNTVLDECGEETLPGSSLPFTIKDTVNADFSFSINYGCQTDTVHYFHPAGNGVNSWQWSLGENQQSGLQNPVAYYQVFDKKTVSLKVSNGFCTDSVTNSVQLINFLKAGFDVYEDNCPQEPILFTNTSVGLIKKWKWEFGDGSFSDSMNPRHIYAIPPRETPYNVKLTVTDSFGCQRVFIKKVVIYSSCYIAVPNAFTPNGDGLNDIFHVLNAVKALNLEFIVYNRWGELVYITSNWKNGWDGRIRGNLPATGVYVWFLRYTERDTRRRREMKGTVTLIR